MALPVLRPYSARTWSKLDIGWTGGYLAGDLVMDSRDFLLEATAHQL